MATEPTPEPGILTYPAGMLNLEYTLSNGQMFRWRQKDGWWDAVTGSRMVRIRQVKSHLVDMDRFEFGTYPGGPDEVFVREFFRLGADLGPVYESWWEADPYLGGLAERFRGLRIVRQKPEECLLCFICSTANLIQRIMKAVAIL